MTLGDVAGALAVVEAAAEQRERRAGREWQRGTQEQRENFLAGVRRFVERDPGGAWIAADGPSLAGLATAIRRGPFWGLSLLFVDPASQDQGLGHRLLDAALSYADGAATRMIMTTTDPRALRRYSRAGLDIHPAVEASGAIDRSTIPDSLPGRSGDTGDLELVASVDEGLRGSRAEDVEYLLSSGAVLQIIDNGTARGYAVHGQKRLMMLGATDDATASLVLWRFLAAAGDEAEFWGMTARQNWAVKVALAAGLQVAPTGPLFIAGREHPPGPWLPSGWYF
jgi:GNAT superfamily N-acetyltransferase